MVMDIERDMPECESLNLSPGDVGYKPKYIVKEMMGETYATYFEEEDSDHPDPERLAERAEFERDRIREEEVADEVAKDHALDNKF